MKIATPTLALPRAHKLRCLTTKLLAFPLCLGFLAAVPAPAFGQRAQTVRAVEVSQESTGTVIRIWTDGDLEDVNYQRISDPTRLVIDLPGLASRLTSNRIEVGSPEVARIRTGLHPDKVRFVIDAGDPKALARARVVRGRQGLGVIVGAADAPDLSRSPYRREASTKLSQPARSAPPSSGGEGDPELALAAQELAAAARELREAIRDLELLGPTAKRTAVSPPQSVASRQAAPPSTTPAPAPRSAAPKATTPQPAPPTAAVAPSRSISPPPETGTGDYATFLAWLRGADEPGFRGGQVFRQANLSQLRPFLAPGYYEEFDFPEVEVTIAPTASYPPHKSFQQATLQFGSQTSLGEDLSLQNYVAGRPFPTERIVNASQREAAYMIAWNLVRRWQHTGYRTRGVQMAYIKAGGRGGRNKTVDRALRGDGNVERHLTQFYQRVYLNHLATRPEDNYSLAVSDAKTHYYKDFMEFTDPFEMRGSMFVIERSVDPYERDQVNSYLPTERRVRRLSPKERADRFAGSEFTLDDFEGFSGRVLDYEWTLLGEKKVLQVIDSQNEHLQTFGPGSRIPQDRWELRDTWVVELRPHLEGHPYGRKILFVDKETYSSSTAVVFDPEDRLLKVMNITFQWPFEGPAPEDAQPADTVLHWHGSIAINKQTDVATVTWGETDIPEVTASTVRRLFSVSNLTGGR